MVKAASIVAFLLHIPFVRAHEPARPDSPEVRPLLDAARKNAGSEWTEAFDFICAFSAGRANSPTDPVIEPTRVFDNLYVVGRTSTAVWIVTTSAGAVLIDSGYADQLESVLLPGMKALGLDPAQVRYVIVGHGHGDHFGGSTYFQQRGARVVMAGPDWNLVESPPAPGRGAAPVQPPKRDVVAIERQAIAVGDVAFTPVMIPGHTPGSIGVIFSVKEGVRPLMSRVFSAEASSAFRQRDDRLHSRAVGLPQRLRRKSRSSMLIEWRARPPVGSQEAG